MTESGIKAVVVNQNTSEFTELLLRSFLRHHKELPADLTVLDNNSTDDMSQLKVFAKEAKIPIRRTEWHPTTPGNNHGENLRDFVIANPTAKSYLFLDCDVVFVQDDTVPTMLEELERDAALWAIQARFTSDGESERPGGSLSKGGQRMFQNIAFESSQEEVAQGAPLQYKPLPAVMGDRVHPCCVLIKNSRAFQMTATHIGFSCAHFEESGCGKVYDTFGTATQVMKTHDLHHGLSEKMIMHFGSVSYGVTPDRVEWCRDLLVKYRRREHS
jgi:hypothetical protein